MQWRPSALIGTVGIRSVRKDLHQATHRTRVRGIVQWSRAVGVGFVRPTTGNDHLFQALLVRVVRRLVEWCLSLC